MDRMTLADLDAVQDDYLTADQVAGHMGTTAESLRAVAREDISKLGFPASMVGHRLYIPKQGYLYWYRYGSMRP